MFKTLKFTGDECNFFAISDLHQRHNRDFIYTKRECDSVEKHDLRNIHNWNAACNHLSTIFHLGDLIFNDSTGEEFWKLMNRLNFKTLYLLIGNHTSGQRQAYIKVLKEKFPDAIEEVNNYTNIKYEIYPLEYDLNSEKKIVFLPQYADIQINSTAITLCHYPIISHYKQGRNSIFLTGHSHGNCAMTNKNTGKGFRLDVGIESFGRPINLKEIKYHLRDRDLDSLDHHNTNDHQ